MSIRLDLLDQTLVVALENYKDNVRILAALDDKAQKMGAIAGLFLGAMFAVIKPDTVGTLRTTVGRVGIDGLTIVIVFLIICIMICLFSMWVGRIPPPLSFEHMNKMTGDLLHLPSASLDEGTREAYGRERIEIWKECLEAQDRVARRKGISVFAAQTVLVIGILAFAVMLLGLLVHTSSPAPGSFEWPLLLIE